MTQTVKNPGGLYVQTADKQQLAFPLKHTDVQAQVTGNLSRVEVTQTFENPFTTTLEAVYIFPLPDEAAVDDMLIRIGDKTIKGRIKKREEAQQIYEQAKQQGRTAGLLEQERDNIFTQSLANIKPGEQIDVIIRYSDKLKFEGGNYEFVFPMVVGPRYIPGTTIEENAGASGSAPAPMTQNQDTDLVPDASRLNAPILPPGMRSRHDINVTVEINAGVEIRDVGSPSHQIQILRENQIVRVNLAEGDTIPNKDLILRYQVAGDNTQATVMTQADEKGGHFAVYLIPSVQYRPNELVPKDVVFLIDTSGSQHGAPLQQCQELMRRFINGLNPNDTFTIIDFADTTQQLSPVPLANTPQNRSRAIKYINKLTADGGTELLHGIRAVLNFPVTDPGRLRSIVLLTDGYIGNENQILAEVQANLKSGNRLYSFGAGSSVNRFLINRIAEIGRGISRIIRQDEPVDEVVEKFFRQINNPVLANIQWQWEGEGDLPEIYPAFVPDLFAEQPLVLFGRKTDKRSGKLQVSGIGAGGSRYQQSFELSFETQGNPAVAQLWGRDRIKDLMNQMVSGDTKSGVTAVTDTALAYQLLSQYTAFVAVSDDVRVNPADDSVSVQVPVEMPEDVSYRGVFGAVAAAPAMMARSIDIDGDGDVEDVTYLAEPQIRARRVPPPASPKAFLASPKADGIWSLFNKKGSKPLSSADVDESIAPGFAEAEYEAYMEEESFQASPAAPPVPWQIISATGLDEAAISLLTKHLESLQLPAGVSGDLVFEFQASKGRVKGVVVEDVASTVTDKKVIEAIRRSLLTWRAPKTLNVTVILTLRIAT
ncbi:VIT domain-containing protein [[Phormidium] sp. ETS-05]|uniref:VIT domain-containing protein n=1 Tax=[Phormidium] sp. ETS-05 TaxID=222819 RepID=UPI0018EEDCBE|nr:VIT domain-containing protein [[Phormidium] sp. ETS-05]